MLTAHFFLRLFFCLIVGLIFVATFNRLATSNPKISSSPRNIKWAAISCYILSGLQFTAFIFLMCNIDSPKEQFESIIPHDGIIRNSHQHIIWGYATQIQRYCFTFFIGAFASLAFAQYFRRFSSSSSTWWGKALKVIWYILIWMLYVNCTDFHYFDFPEFVKTIIFGIAIWICFSRRQTPKIYDKTEDDVISVVGLKNNHSNNLPTNNSLTVGNNHTASKEEPSIILNKQRRKSFFWVFFLVGIFITSGISLLYACFSFDKIYIDDASQTIYQYRNSQNSRRVIFPFNDADGTVSYSNYYDTWGDRIPSRLKPFKGLRADNWYSGQANGLQLTVYNNPYHTNGTSESLALLLTDVFADAEDFPSNYFTDASSFNDYVMGGHPAFSYYFSDPDGYKLATVFSTETKWDDKVCVVLSSGSTLEYAQKQRDTFLSHFKIYDFSNCIHISVGDIEAFNCIGIIVVCLLFLSFVFIEFKSYRRYSKVLNNQAKIIVLLNCGYIIGWAIFALVLVLNNSYGDVDLAVWGLMIPIWIIGMLISRFAIAKCFASKTEFYLIPQFIKNKLRGLGLNTQSIYRLILLLIGWPMFYLLLIPVAGFFPMWLIVGTSLILCIILVSISVYKWIAKGKGIHVD